jgi:hypothetical protein
MIQLSLGGRKNCSLSLFTFLPSLASFLVSVVDRLWRLERLLTGVRQREKNLSRTLFLTVSLLQLLFFLLWQNFDMGMCAFRSLTNEYKAELDERSYQWFLLGLLGIAVAVRASAWAINRLNRAVARDPEQLNNVAAPRGTVTRARDALMALFTPLSRSLEPVTSNSVVKVVIFLTIIVINIVFSFVSVMIRSFHLC